MQNINKELEEAVWKDDLEKVKALLSAGANANIRVGMDEETLLHSTYSVEMIKVLLLGGAKVDGRNKYSETPLHTAITKGKKLEFVRELLKHGAEVDATNRKRNTPLNLAIMKSDTNLEIVKELLKYGADINIESREWYVNFPTNRSPLDHAVILGKLECAKLLIKLTLVRLKSIKNYKNVIDLSPLKKCSSYSATSSYLDDCVCEILQMKTDVIEDGLPLYELVANNSNIHVRYNNQLSVKLSKIDNSMRYPIYNDVISEKLKPFAERIDLLNKLSTIQFYTILDVADQDAKKRKIILDQDSTYHVTEFLSNDSLSNFIVAFDDSNKCTFQSLSSSDNLEEPSTGFNETFMSSDAKRAKLDHFCKY